MQRKQVEIATKWIPAVGLTFQATMSMGYCTLTTNNIAVRDLEYPAASYANSAKDVQQTWEQ